METSTAAILFVALTVIVVLFQLALAAGLPWGAASMGGKFPGKYPPRMRFVAILNAAVMSFLAFIVLSKASLGFPVLSGFSGTAIWFVVALFVPATVLNCITPSKIERIWAPVALTQFFTSLLVALS